MSLPMCVASNDHYWHGSSICSACGARLRCGCGRFVREDGFDEHLRQLCPLPVTCGWVEPEPYDRWGEPLGDRCKNPWPCAEHAGLDS